MARCDETLPAIPGLPVRQPSLTGIRTVRYSDWKATCSRFATSTGVLASPRATYNGSRTFARVFSEGRPRQRPLQRFEMRPVHTLTGDPLRRAWNHQLRHRENQSGARPTYGGLPSSSSKRAQSRASDVGGQSLLWLAAKLPKESDLGLLGTIANIERRPAPTMQIGRSRVWV
jgi:hypothetical protein